MTSFIVICEKFIAYMRRENYSSDLRTKPRSRVVLVPIERTCRSSNFYGELISMKTFKCRKDYGILKFEHKERHAS